MSKIDPYSLSMVSTSDLLEELKNRCTDDIIVAAFLDDDPEAKGAIKFYMHGDITERIKLIKYMDIVVGEEFLNGLKIIQQ
jgi:hypothetical protein